MVSLGFRKIVKNITREELKHPCKVDISWSAHHGRGFFRAVVKVVARIYGKKLSFIHRLSQMQWEKNTYEVICKTMGPDLNRG